MDSIEPHRPSRNNRFDPVAEPFLQSAFGGFAKDGIFSTPLGLWAYLVQVLRDGKGAACAAAVADIGMVCESVRGTSLVPGGRSMMR